MEAVGRLEILVLDVGSCPCYRCWRCRRWPVVLVDMALCVRRARAGESDSSTGATRGIRTGMEAQELCGPRGGLGGRAVATPRGG